MISFIRNNAKSFLAAGILLPAIAMLFSLPAKTAAQQADEADPAGTTELPTSDIGENVPDTVQDPFSEGQNPGAASSIAQGAIEGSLTLTECEGGKVETTDVLKGAAQGALNAGISYFGKEGNGGDIVSAAAQGAAQGGGAGDTSASGIGSTVGGAAGAIAGSVIPGAGTAVGGAVGSSLGGLVGGLLGGGGGKKGPNKVVENSVRKKEQCLDGLANMASNELIANLTDSASTWVKSGFTRFGKEGNPSIVQNLDQHLTSLAYNEVNRYLRNSENFQDVCSIYQNDVLLSLQQDFRANPQAYGTSSQALISSLPDVNPGNCDLEEAVSATSAQEYITGDFTEGGWESWSDLTGDFSNTPVGAYLEKRREYESQVEEARQNRRDRLNQSGGFLSQRDSSGAVVTPGSVVSSIFNTLSTSDVRRAELADEVDEAVTSFGSTAIANIMGAGTDSEGEPAGGFEESSGIIGNDNIGGDIEDRVRNNFIARLEDQLRTEYNVLSGLKQAQMLIDPDTAQDEGIASTPAEQQEINKAKQAESMTASLEQCIQNNDLENFDNVPRADGKRITVINKTKQAISNTLKNRTKLGWNGTELQWVPLIAEDSATRVGWNGRRYDWQKDLQNWDDYEKNDDEVSPTDTRFWYPFQQGWQCSQPGHQGNRFRYHLALYPIDDPANDAGGIFDDVPPAANTAQQALKLSTQYPIRSIDVVGLARGVGGTNEETSENATSTQTGDVRILDAMPNPAGNDSEEEYVTLSFTEGRNMRPSINVDGWTLETGSSTDSSTSHTFEYTGRGYGGGVPINKDSPLVVCRGVGSENVFCSRETKEASIELPDDGGELTLLDDEGNQVASATYSADAVSEGEEITFPLINNDDIGGGENDTDYYWMWNQHTCWEESKHEEWKGEGIFQDHGNEDSQDFFAEEPSTCNLNLFGGDDTPECGTTAFRPPEILSGTTYQQQGDAIVESDCETAEDVGTHYFVRQGENNWRKRECVLRRSPQGPPVHWKPKDSAMEAQPDFIESSELTDLPAFKTSTSTAPTARLQTQQELVSELCGLAGKLQVSTSSSEFIRDRCNYTIEANPTSTPSASQVQTEFYDLQGDYIMHSDDTAEQIQERLSFYTTEIQDLNRTALANGCGGSEELFDIGGEFGYATTTPAGESSEPGETPSLGNPEIGSFTASTQINSTSSDPGSPIQFPRFNPGERVIQVSWFANANQCIGASSPTVDNFDGNVGTSSSIIFASDKSHTLDLECQTGSDVDTDTVYIRERNDNE